MCKTGSALIEQFGNRDRGLSAIRQLETTSQDVRRLYASISLRLGQSSLRAQPCAKRSSDAAARTNAMGFSMSTKQAAIDPPVTDPFIKDAHGRTLFYPLGTSSSGYAVADEKREQVLRDAMARYREIAKRVKPWASLLVAPFLFPLYYFLSSRPFFALGAFLLAMALFILADRAFLRYRLRPWLIGLEKVESIDKRPQRNLRILAFILVLLSIVAWLTLRLYQRRIDALPAVDGTTIYYAGISLSLMFALIISLFFLLTILGRKNLITRLGDNRYLLTLLVLTVIDFCLLGYMTMNFFNPAPEVVITRDALQCNWSVQWSDVTDLDLKTGRHGKRYAWLNIGSEPQKAPWQTRNAKQCEISGLNEDYSTVYQSIRAAWQDEQSRSARAVTR